MVQGRENLEVAARAGFCVWPRNVVQFETSAPVCCRGGFAKTITTIFVVTCTVLRRGHAAELVNNIPHLMFDPLQ